MEVLVALSIFLLSFAVLSQLITLASERAHDVEMRTRAAQLCQSKMNEVTSGLVALSSVESTPFDDPDGDWQWSLDAEQSSSVPGLWTVTVRVSRTSPDGPQAETELWGMLLDPSQRGNAMDTITVTSSTSSGSSSSSSSSTDTSGNSTTSPSTTTPSTTPSTPSSGGTPATKPATGTPTGGATKPATGNGGAPAGGKPAGSTTTGNKPAAG
jgi:hypothetical protein